MTDDDPVYVSQTTKHSVFHAHRDCDRVDVVTFERMTTVAAEDKGLRPADCCAEYYHFDNPGVLEL